MGMLYDALQCVTEGLAHSRWSSIRNQGDTTDPTVNDTVRDIHSVPAAGPKG